MKNTKFEARNTKQIRNSNVRIIETYCFGHLNFGHSILFRISDFDIRIYTR